WCCMSSVDVIGGVVGWLLAGVWWPKNLAEKKGGGGAKVEGDGVDVMMAAGRGEAGDEVGDLAGKYFPVAGNKMVAPEILREREKRY
ncbi:hypothetical protein Tco_0759010, partial [Tanacetum coccineum]